MVRLCLELGGKQKFLVTDAKTFAELLAAVSKRLKVTCSQLYVGKVAESGRPG